MGYTTKSSYCLRPALKNFAVSLPIMEEVRLLLSLVAWYYRLGQFFYVCAAFQDGWCRMERDGDELIDRDIWVVMSMGIDVAASRLKVYAPV